MSPLPNFAGGPPPPTMGGGPPRPDPSSLPPPPGGPGGGGPDAVNGQLQATMGKIRALGQAASDIAASVPALQDEAQQIQALIRRMVIKAGQGAPTQTDSGSAVPMG
jgi:hypothetical protein